MKLLQTFLLLFLFLTVLQFCKNVTDAPSREVITQLHLKRGSIIACGPPDAQFGTVDFVMTCDSKKK